MGTEMRWNGEQNVRLASETNPWLRNDASGADVDLQVMVDEGRVPVPLTPDCCYSGIIPAMDTNEGIQRCDTCQVYDGDLEAAQALADRIGGVSVWFTGTEFAHEKPMSGEHPIADLDLV